MNDHANLTDQPDQSVQNSSQVPEDHADVVTATAEHGKKRVAPWVPFRVLRLSRPSFFMCPIIGSIALRRHRSLAIVPVDTTLCAADENHSHFHAMATVSAIDKGHPGPLACDGLDLFQRLGQRVAIMGIARQRPYPDHKAAPVGRSHADPGAKRVALVRLAASNSRASVGWAMFFSITVVSTVTRLRSLLFTAPDCFPASIVSVNTHSTPSSPIRFRQRVREDGSIG